MPSSRCSTALLAFTSLSQPALLFRTRLNDSLGIAGVDAVRMTDVTSNLAHENWGEASSDDLAEAAEITKTLTYERIGRCWDPSRVWDAREAPTAGQPEWEAAFAKQVELVRNSTVADLPHAQTLQRPVNAFVKMLGPLSGLAFALPEHGAVALTNQRSDFIPEGQTYADSHCFQFDYAGFKEGDADPHGCGFFRKSFQPLKELRQCIIGKLQGSPAWSAYRRISNRIHSKRKDNSKVVDDPLAVDAEEEEEERKLSGSDRLVKMTFDDIRRADEIIKSVSSEAWAAEVVEHVESKIAQTIITRDHDSVMEKDVVTSIREDCFHVEAAATLATLKASALTLRRALPCQFMMWDQVEVAGEPDKPLSNAITMWDDKLKYKGRVKIEHDTPPVCARAALSLISEQTRHAPEGYKMQGCSMSGSKSWQKCLHPNSYNCICFYLCWGRALEQLCTINPSCCGSNE